MRGRGGGGDPDFGSDSFLDIIANLVGILIVLIVLAGLRAAQLPPEPVIATTDEPAASIPAPVEVEPVLPPALPIEPEPEPAELVVEAPVEEPGITLDEARQQIAMGQQQIEALKSRLNNLNLGSSQREVATLQQQLADRSARLRALQAKLEESATQSGLLTAELSNVDREYQQLRMRLLETNKRLEAIQGRKRPEKQLELRINPVGRRSTGEEILFRIENGRIVHLPIRELIETAIRMERSSMGSILGGRTQRGVAGPVDGIAFNYQYGIASVPAYSASGSQMVSQIRLRGLLKTLPGAPSEPIGKALATGGVVERLLVQAAPGTVIRLAVSTESFGDARRVASYARDLNFAVASRPIEPGSDLPVHLSDRSDAIAQ